MSLKSYFLIDSHVFYYSVVLSSHQIHVDLISFVSISADFGICIVVGLNRTFVEAKNTHLGHLNVRILASTSYLFRPTTVQMPNLALIETTSSISVHDI